MLDSLTVNSSKDAINFVSTKLSPENIKPFNTNPPLTIPNLVDGEVRLKTLL